VRRGTEKSVDDKWFTAVKAGDTKEVARMLQKGQMVDEVNRSNKTALLLAAGSGYEDMVNLLIFHQANVNHNASGWSALHETAQAIRAGIAKLLIDNGADPSMPNAGFTPLTVSATQSPNVGMVLLFQHYGVDPWKTGNTTLLTDADVSQEVRGRFCPTPIKAVNHLQYRRMSFLQGLRPLSSDIPRTSAFRITPVLALDSTFL